MRIDRVFCCAFVAALAAGCSVPRIPGVTPYRIDVQQGNFLTQEQVSSLKPGMSKEQVRLALGTPLLTDIFHANRWDYVYTREHADGKKDESKLVVFFNAEERLERVEGGVLNKDGAKDSAKGSTKGGK